MILLRSTIIHIVNPFVTLGHLIATEGVYTYPEEQDNASVMRIVKPRLIDYEQGWSWVRPENIVRLSMVREKSVSLEVDTDFSEAPEEE